jgi:catalase-peroxidase
MINVSGGVLPGRAHAHNANYGQSKHGVSTNRPETLTNDFFVNLLDMGGPPLHRKACLRSAIARRTKSSGQPPVSICVFGSNSQLRAIAEVYTWQNLDPSLFLARAGRIAPSLILLAA